MRQPTLTMKMGSRLLLPLLLAFLACERPTDDAVQVDLDENGHQRCEKTTECEHGRTCYGRRCLTSDEVTAKQYESAASAETKRAELARSAAEAALQPKPPPVTGNKAHDLIAAQSDAERNATLTSVVKGSKERCDRVTRSFFQGIEPKSGEAYWNVQCHNRRSYAIAVYNDASGSTRVLACDVLKEIGVECFRAFEDVAEEPSARPLHKNPSPVKSHTPPATRTCCKHCNNSRPCGDSCISLSKTCHKGAGCAC